MRIILLHQDGLTSLQNIDHGDIGAIVDKKVLMVVPDDLCPPRTKCKFCQSLVVRIKSRVDMHKRFCLYEQTDEKSPQTNESDKTLAKVIDEDFVRWLFSENKLDDDERQKETSVKIAAYRVQQITAKDNELFQLRSLLKAKDADIAALISVNTKLIATIDDRSKDQ